MSSELSVFVTVHWSTQTGEQSSVHFVLAAAVHSDSHEV
jgi:hypothetical protein